MGIGLELDAVLCKPVFCCGDETEGVATTGKVELEVFKGGKKEGEDGIFCFVCCGNWFTLLFKDWLFGFWTTFTKGKELFVGKELIEFDAGFEFGKGSGNAATGGGFEMGTGVNGT